MLIQTQSVGSTVARSVDRDDLAAGVGHAVSGGKSLAGRGHGQFDAVFASLPVLATKVRPTLASAASGNADTNAIKAAVLTKPPRHGSPPTMRDIARAVIA
jgi:hypothetical protein